MAEKVNYDVSYKHAEHYIEKQVRDGRLSNKEASSLLKQSKESYRNRNYERAQEIISERRVSDAVKV